MDREYKQGGVLPMHTGTLEHSTAFSTQPTNIQALYGSQQGQFGLEDLNKCRSVSNSLL